MSIDLKEIADYCMSTVKNEVEQSQRKYDYSILYVAVYKDGSIMISQTPHLLSSASSCLLVHSWEELASTIYYDTYSVQFINEKGEVRQDNLDDDYEMHVYPSSYNSPAQIVLFRNHEEIYRKPIWENGRSTLKEQIMFIWNLYRKSKKECGTLKESQLLGRLAEKEQTIQFLESKLADSSVQDRLLNEEISQYRKLLLEIQEMLNATKICVNLQEDY